MHDRKGRSIQRGDRVRIVRDAYNGPTGVVNCDHLEGDVVRILMISGLYAGELQGWFQASIDLVIDPDFEMDEGL